MRCKYRVKPKSIVGFKKTLILFLKLFFVILTISLIGFIASYFGHGAEIREDLQNSIIGIFSQYFFNGIFFSTVMIVLASIGYLFFYMVTLFIKEHFEQCPNYKEENK